MKRYLWPTSIVLCLILLAGAAARVYRLSAQSITHVECYVPGIQLPRDLAEFPLPWYTFRDVLIKCSRSEPTPPLYYLLMLEWTNVFGTSVLSLRIPSVLAGLATIALLFVLGKREGGSATGLLAAGMLALNGFHLHWSQLARPYIVVCLLGVLSTVLLLRLTRAGSRTVGSLVLYGASTLAGLGMDIRYWPIFATQILWVAIACLKRKEVPQLLRWQFFIFLLASPLLMLVARNSGRSSPAVGEPLTLVSEFLQFGFLFERYDSSPIGLVATGAALALSALALFLVAVGLATKRVAEFQADLRAGPPFWLTACAGLAVFAVILIASAAAYSRSSGTAMRMMATLLIPPGLILLDRLLGRFWPWVQKTAPDPERLLPSGLLTLSGLLAVVPIAAILVISRAVPLYASRGCLPYVPFLILTAARGFVQLVRRDVRWLALGMIVALGHVASIDYFYRLPFSARDYKAISQELASRVRESDLIFVRGNHWQTTPIFYYMKSDRYDFVGKDYGEKIVERPRARVWAVTWQNNDVPSDMIEALQGYLPTEQINVLGAQAVLYTRAVNGSVGLAPSARVRSADRPESTASAPVYAPVE
jgi:4-amino-4-deoxy-L-arabinose transferase-like glycosyltransferase